MTKPLLFRLTVLTFLSCSAALLSSNASQARGSFDAPPPAAKAQNLEALEGTLETYKQERKDIEQTLSALAQDVEANKDKQIALAKDIQMMERNLKALEAQIEAKQSQKDTLSSDLETEKQHMAELVLALDKLQRVPPLALALHPAAPLETAQTALVMQDMGKSLARRSQIIRDKSKQLEAVLAQLSADKTQAEHDVAQLSADRKTLDMYLNQQELFYRRTQNDLAEKEKHILEISQQAASMRDFLDRLKVEKERAKQEQKQKQAQTQERTAQSNNTSSSLFGFIPTPKAVPNKASKSGYMLPVSGSVKVAFGQKDHLDAPSQGWWVEGRRDALVIAPFDGTVRFVGQFKNYGNLMIIEHDGNYHSLIAGFQTVTAQLDQKLRAGEPVGYMKTQNAQGGAPLLYYELRKTGKAIDPAQKFGKL